MEKTANIENRYGKESWDFVSSLVDQKLKEAAHTKLKELIKPKRNIKIEAEYKFPLNIEKTRTIIEKGLDFVKSLTNMYFYVNYDDLIYFDVALDGRANHSRYEGKIRLDKDNPSISTTIHELGHYLETVKPDALDLAIKFFKHRCRDEKPTEMSTVANGAMKGEFGRKDKFDQFFENSSSSAYYCGKTYLEGTNIIATEIISMGLQALYDDPIGFCKKDPEYASFIIHVLRM